MRVVFLMEQHIGHRSFYLNLRRYVSIDPRIDPRWVEISYNQPGGWIERSPLIPAAWKGSLRGLVQTRRGIAAFPAEIAFFNTQSPASFVADRLSASDARRGAARRYILCTDITPLQYTGMALDYHHRSTLRGPFKAIKDHLDRAVFRGAAHVIAWSNWTRDSLLGDYGLPEDHVSVIPPGVDLEIWHPSLRKRAAESGTRKAEIRKRKVDSGQRSAPPLKLLFVGGDFTRKGGRVLLEALKQLDLAVFEPHLVTHEAVPHQPGMHIYHGLEPNSPDLVRLYQESDLFVLPSLAEAFGIAAVEALACGLPVIAARVGGLLDVVEDGENGLLVPPGDANALAQAILHLATDRDMLLRMGQRARAIAEERFSAEKNANRCVALLLQHGLAQAGSSQSSPRLSERPA